MAACIRGSAKSITLSDRACSALGIDGQQFTPGRTGLQQLLRAPVDLLYNGGIGTYIKASRRTGNQRANITNDNLHQCQRNCCAAVITEGGNLA